MDLNRVDLNLMVAFEALMAERGVSAAALRLGLSQPAMSAALQRLRALFGDALFVRAGRVMLPTVRAVELEGQIGQALAQLRGALAPRAPFDPKTSRRAFTLSGGDYASMIILPRLAAHLAAAAPGLDLRFRFVEKQNVISLLDTGMLDIALGVFPEPPKRLGIQRLFEEYFVGLARRDHPGLQAGMTIDAYTAAAHLLVTERGDAVGAVDEALARLGRERRIALTVPHVLVVPAILTRTQLVATVGQRVARAFAQEAALTMFAVPVIMPTWNLTMLWSRQRAGDQGLEWLRAVLVEVCALV
jgi:DNA-binding transcriptional LysR family regulator